MPDSLLADRQRRASGMGGKPGAASVRMPLTNFV
jgi:hypothetical protein